MAVVGVVGGQRCWEGVEIGVCATKQAFKCIASSFVWQQRIYPIRQRLRTICVDDFFDTTMIVKMKTKSPQLQETVNVVISFDYQKRNKRISVKGKCLETDRDSEGDYYATIELEPTDLKVFEQFMMLYRLRQQHIHQFLKAAKGL